MKFITRHQRNADDSKNTRVFPGQYVSHKSDKLLNNHVESYTRMAENLKVNSETKHFSV